MIPLLSGKAIGVAIEGGQKEALAEAARVLIPGGRVAVIRPLSEAATVLELPPFELLAADPRAIVARKI
jgi:ubiquinone/menaquinone biosynthesis C-methylase UbiE